VEARVPLIDDGQVPPLLARHFEGGDPGVIVRALASVPELAEVAIPFIGTVLGPGSLPAVPKEVAVLRTSALLDCRYCIDSRTVAATEMGLDRALVQAALATPAGERLPGLDDAMAAVVAWIDAVAVGTGPVPDRTFAAVAAVLAAHQIVELTVVVGTTVLLNRFCTSLALPTSAETRAALAQQGFSS